MKTSLKIAVVLLTIFPFFIAVPAFAQPEPILRIDPGGHMAVIWKVLFTPDGRHVVSAGEDKTIRVWDVETGEQVRKILGQISSGQAGKILSMALSPDGGTLAVGGFLAPAGQDPYELGALRLHDFHTGDVLSLLKGHVNVVTALDFSRDGRFLASGGADRNVILRTLKNKPDEPPLVLQGHTDMVGDVAFSPDGERLVSGGYDGALCLWNTSDGSLIKKTAAHQSRIWSVACSPDGKYIASAGSSDLLIKLWNMRDGSFIKDLVKVNRHPPGLAFTPDGKGLVAAAQEGQGPFNINIIDVETGGILTSFPGHRNSVKTVAVSPDGKLAASAGGSANEVYIWSTANGQPVHKCAGTGASVWSVGAARDGSEIAIGNALTSGDIMKYGPLSQSIRLKDAGDWGVWMGGEVKDESRFIRAAGRSGPWSAEVKPGGPAGWNAILRILQNGQVVHEIVRDAHNGSEHRCFTFTPDGKTIASGGNNGVLTAYDVETGSVVTEFIGHEAEVWAVAASEDGRFLVSGSYDQTVRIWDLTRIRQRSMTYPLISIFAGEDREWVAWTPKGYYTCSVQGDRYIGWHVNHGLDKAADFFPADRFASKLYRPDVVSNVLKSGDVDQGVAEAGKMKKTDRNPRLTDMIPPAVYFITPDNDNVESGENIVRIKAGAKSLTESPVTEFILLHNGRPVMEAELSGENEKEPRLEAEVKLQPGKNIFTLTAANTAARSNPESITVINTARDEGELFKPDLYVLAIGVSDYQQPQMNLDLAHVDALTVAGFFEKQQGKLYKNVNVKILVNENATRSAVLDALDWMMRQTTQNDVAILFVAGHGVNDGRGGYYFMGYDADPEKIRRSGVEWFHFQDVLTAIPSKIILMADTCHSGNITGSRIKTRGASDMTEAVKSLVNTDTGVVVITAATGRESSMESLDWGHGAFTKALIEGLEGEADYNKNGFIEIKEIDLFITHKVKELTGGEQHPTTEIPASLPNFAVSAR